MCEHTTPDVDVECRLCGYLIPADAGERNDYHDSECEHFVRVMTREDAEAELLELLDDLHGTLNVCGYDYSAGELLRRVDPVAFNEELLNHCDTHGIEIL